MPAFLLSLLPIALIPHGHCYLWKPGLVGLHAGSDALIALAYYAIPMSLFYFVRKRQDLPFPWAFLLFATFIIACGTTHLMEIWTLWYPTYWVAGAIKAVTAIASIATAVLVVPLIPKALALPSPAELEAANQKLQSEIAERQRLQKEWDGFFKLSPDLLCITTFDGYFQYVNPACENETGFTAAELLAHPYLNLIYPEDRAALADDARKVMRGIDTSNFESRIQCKDGSVKWIAWSANANLEEQFVYVVGRNVTERKYMEEALQQTEAQFRHLLQDLHIGVLLQGPEAEILLSNPEALKLLGLTEDQLLGKTSFDPSWNVIHEDGSPFPGPLHPVPQAIATRQAVRNVVMGVYRPQTKDRVWLLVDAEPELNDDGSIRQIICTFNDISDRQAALRERKAAEEELKQQHELLQTIMDHVPVMLALINPQGHLQWVNREWEKILGWSAEEWQQRDILTELYPDPTYRQIVLDFIQASAGRWQDFRLQTRSGTVIDAAWANVRLSDGTNIGIGQDITERKLAEEALRQQTERKRVLVKITEHIRQSLELEDILHTAVAEVRQLLHCDRVVIYRFNADRSGSIVAESVHPNELSVFNQVIYDPCFATGWYDIYQQGRISAIADINEHPLDPCYRKLLTSLRVQANLVVPILHETTLWGLLIAHHCWMPHSWQPWEIDSLSQLTTQLAIAIHQSELYHQVQRFNARLEQQVEERTEQLQRALDFEALMKRITDKVRDSLDESHILQTAVQELAIGLNVYSCDAGLYDLEQHTSTICYEYVRCEVPPAQGKTIHLSEQQIYYSLLQEDALQFCWMPEQPNLARPISKRLTTLACRVVDDQAMIGELWLYKSAAASFEELEVRLVRQVANQCAIAVRQARLYQSAQAQVKELERLNHLKDDFLNTVSHELRTPMSNIKMATQILEVILTPLGVLDPETGSASHYFQILQDECQRELSLINDLLDLSRLESGVEPLAIVPVDLRLWIPHILEPFEERTRVLQQQLQLDLPEQLPFLETDLFYLERSLTELLNNACKYTPSNETILISVKSTPAELQLSVSNSGVEIPPTELPHLFEKFYRVPSHDPWKHGGTGLGLALVQRCVRQLQGAITVVSEHGWTTFTLVLPWSISNHQ